MLWLDTLDLSKVIQEHGEAQAGKSVDKQPLSVGGKAYERGIGTHARSEMTIALKKAATRFEAAVGVDNEVGGWGSVVFEVWVDGRRVARTGVLSGGDAPVAFSVDLTGASKLSLVVKDAGDGNGSDHADWADARLILDPAATELPEMVDTDPPLNYAARPSTEPVLQIPKGIGALVGGRFSYEIVAAGAEPLTYSVKGLPDGLAFNQKTNEISGTIDTPGDHLVDVEVRNGEGSDSRIITISALDLGARAPAEPIISGPRVVGTTPGRPFLFRIPASGEGQLSFAAENLPNGLLLDSKTGIITGSLPSDGEFIVNVTVTGPRGVARGQLTIIGGDRKLAQTPPMGYNSWNAWGMSVSAQRIREAADAMIDKGLAAVGFQYVNIDDGWEGQRNPDGEITANEKFGDMNALADYVHSRGLKIGIYSSPGPSTCGGLEGSYQHEEQDALTWSKWGVDYLKYDWCSYGQIVDARVRADHEKPYKVMRAALDKCDRDIVYSVGWSEPEVHIWAPALGGNLWRTTGDITDNWGSLNSIGFRHDGYDAYAGPGHWNDPDMLVVGKVGWGPTVHVTRLTPYEQITHITLWCLLAAPLLIGCDMASLDDFTIALLTNPEVIDIDQDPLGKAASRRSADGPREVWARPLFDGTTAVGLFNRGEEETEVTAEWSDLGMSGALPVRDLWLRRNLGKFSDRFTTRVPRHGAVMLKIG